MSPRRPLGLRLLVPALTALALASPVARAEVAVEARLESSLDAVWARMPQSGDGAGVRLAEGTNEHCAGLALQTAKRAITAADVRAGAWRAFAITVDVAQDVLDAYGFGL